MGEEEGGGERGEEGEEREKEGELLWRGWPTGGLTHTLV